VTSVIAADDRHVWHPYTQHGLPDPRLEIVRASGAYLETRDGRKIFDGISSWWVTLHGHAHPRIAAAIAEQAATLEQVIFAGFTHEPGARLAEELVAHAPIGLDIGAVTPQEIAVSILAELIAVKHGKEHPAAMRWNPPSLTKSEVGSLKSVE